MCAAEPPPAPEPAQQRALAVPGPASLDDCPAVAASLSEAAVILPGAAPRLLPAAEAARALRGRPMPILCHAPTVARRLGVARFPALDLLELYAFARPARFCLPTPAGLARALGLPAPEGLEDAVRLLRRAADALLAALAEPDFRDMDAAPIARAMGDGGWPWAPHVLAALARRGFATDDARPRQGLDVWVRLPSWPESAPEPAAGHRPVSAAEARARLAQMVGAGAEPRPQQSDYASAVAAAFQPRETEGAPHFVIAEAGTGVGKTLGYLAPASVWAEKNGGTVWISTYTRNLQRQIDGELDRLHPEPHVKARRVVVRKGRENYLCLLNYEDALARAVSLVALGLVARWARLTRGGDIAGGDFPAWLADLVGPRDTLALADRRGECVYAACAHYGRCFVERTVRQARRADLVVANHALVMAQAALGGLDDGSVPTRLVFDEGHHVFDAADSAFSAELSGRRGAELRRWLLGAEGARGSRARGLSRRIVDLAEADGPTGAALAQVLDGALALPAPGWQARLAEGRTRNPAEAFLALVRRQVYARAAGPEAGYDLETSTAPPVDGLGAAAAGLETALAALSRPMKALAGRLMALMDEQAASLETAQRQRIEAVARGLVRRAESEVDAWRSMLGALAAETPAAFVDWFSVSRDQGRDVDAAMHRHWVDPTIPFARHVAGPAHGVLVTSATLRDGTGDNDADWAAAEAMTGAAHLAAPAVRAQVPSPFDYAAQTRVFVVTDVRRNDPVQVAAACRELFLAAGGGALGLFTAIARLRAVHARIAGPLEAAGLPLLAQHVDSMDTASLVDIFRAEEDACILGTDAIRDGVDVPGRSLRLVVFDRVPWPRPTILHRARRAAFGGAAWDDRIVRLRLKQGYGRLVRRGADCGVFVMLDAAMPSRLAGAFPDGVAVRRLGLAEAVAETRAFLAGAAREA
jgi:ATP-dependent DNA helicase DinG